MVRIADNNALDLHDAALALRARYVELRDRVVSTRAEFVVWHADSLALFRDTFTDLVLPMRDAMRDLVELRAIRERQHEAERVGDRAELVRTWMLEKQFVQNGRGVTTAIRTWATNHENDPDWHAKLIARLDEADGV